MKSSKLVAPNLSSKGGHTPERIPTQAQMWPLSNGHLTDECSFTLDGDPECPQCVAGRIAVLMANGEIKP